ncbi:MAG: response regulator [Promethearchaeota archaeon]|jgi:CheY-like chemotaxis protein
MSSPKAVLMVVDDNQDILFNLKILLESKNYEVTTASSGKQAIDMLLSGEIIPEVIISDIMMPKMNGYEFFAAVSAQVHLSQIPFLFLTAKSTPEDIRLGKMLGADDYITKPFNEKDLIASISGKIARKKRSNLIDSKVKQILESFEIEIQPSISEGEELPFCLLIVYWDDVAGPMLKISYPSEKSWHLSINTIGKQLFHAAKSIYGQDKITQAQGILLNIENIQKKGYVFFDSYPDANERYGEKQFMLSVIAPTITYFDSLKIRDIFKEISEKIKSQQDWDIKLYWDKILEILSSGSLLLKPQ